MKDQIETDLPDGVLVSLDAGTPSALEGGDWGEALEFPVVLEQVAGFAAGPLGAESVRSRRPVADLAWIQAELLKVEELARLGRVAKGLVAEAVPDLARPLARLRIPGSVLDGAELVSFRQTLAATRLVTAELRRIAPDAPHVAALEVAPPEKSLERRLEQALDDDGGVRDTASPALAAARSDIRTARERLVQRLEAILRATGGEGTVTLRDGRYVIPVSRDLRSRPDGNVVGESSSGATLYIEPSSTMALGNALREAEAQAVREELKVLRSLSEMLRPEHQSLRQLHAMCVTVDDLSARAKWAVAVDGYAPSVSSAPSELRVVNGRHPLLIKTVAAGETGNSTRNAEPGTRPSAFGSAERDPARGSPSGRNSVVPFDLTLEGPERTVLLSGPNTGGKSVLLKAVGLHLALAQSGIVPPIGPGSALPVVTRIFADIGDRQSIAASLSTFSAHLALLRLILAQADDASLVLLDEIGSGTDPAEGGALASATLETLTRRGTMTLATTHLGALKELATRTAGIVNASLQFDAATLQPTYRLVKGIPGRSYGIAIARRLGLPEDLLASAEAQVPDRERSLDALLAAVELRERDQMRREQELAAQATENQARAAGLEFQAESQTIREAALKKLEKEAERVARERARQYLLEAREKVEAAIARVEATADSESAREARRMVEQAAGAEAEALKALAGDPGAREGGPAEGLPAGQRVRLESGTVGEVLETRSDGKVVVRVGSLKLVADPASLTPIAGDSRRSAPAPSRPEPTEATSYEVDLRGLTGDEAEQTVLAALDAAILAEQPYLRIIHGKGTGVVRDRVQQVVRRDRRIKSHAFAPSNQGGTGVTMVEFSQ